MGRDTVRMEIVGYVSRHNSEQDRKDDADWAELQERIRMIVREHRYEGLDLEMW